MRLLRQKELLEYRKELLDVKMMRWNDLPDFGVYSDQVLSIIEEQLSFLQVTEVDRVITPTMINNYVKLKLIERPVKKKYDKQHIAKLIVISMLKQVLPLTDVHKGIQLQVSLKGTEVAYNSFCDEIEQSFKQLFGDLGKEDFSFTIDHINQDNLALKMVTLSLASKLLTQKIIMLNGIHEQNQLPKIEGENTYEK